MSAEKSAASSASGASLLRSAGAQQGCSFVSFCDHVRQHQRWIFRHPSERCKRWKSPACL